jgi:hypothetical protein
MYFFIELAARAAKLPDSATPPKKAKVALLSLLNGASAPNIAAAIQAADEKLLATLVRIVYPGTKARQRSFLMAQLIAAFMKISEEEKPFKQQKVHPRRKVVGLLVELLKAGEEFDWTKASKNGFNIQPANVSASSKDAVDLFTGEVMETVTRRLKAYGITPAAYRKLFNAPNARITSVKYSTNTKKSMPKGTQIQNAPNQKGGKKPNADIATKLRAIRNLFTTSKPNPKFVKAVIEEFNEIITNAGSMGNQELVYSLEELADSIENVPAKAEGREYLAGLSLKIRKISIPLRASKAANDALKMGSET